MLDYVESHIKFIEEFAKEQGEVVELLIIGGLAMSLYGIPRFTNDIDGEIKCGEQFFYDLIRHLNKKGIVNNLSDNVSGWGIIPLPEGYIERAEKVYKSNNLVVKILDPADFVISKILRGTEEDFRDSLAVIKKYKISKESLIERKELIQFPRDPEVLFFNKKFENLLEISF